ncbi:MAG TPA: TonB-dependent receptor [Vicinamibacterales bacterium]|nr:TonB-dependent receptor [Vicinamibacterales bacterium]
MPHLHSAPGIALRLFVLAGLALCGTSGEAAEADSNHATPPHDTKLSGGRTGQPEPAQLEGVVVVGSRLPESAGQSAQDIHIYDRERIDRSGQTTVTDFLATLPEVSLKSVESSNLSTTVRLRGAVQGSPLILINGRRAQPVTGGAAFGGYFDLNTIPLSLVERIDILPVASSAIYGGEGLAGVVNIVLRSNFTGAEAGAGYQWAKNTDQQLYYAGAGWTTGDFSMSIIGSYSDRTSMFGKDRAITNSPDYRSVGGPNLGTQFFGVPANVSSVSGDLPGLNSSFAAVPVASSGVGLRPSDFAATAGTQNTGSFTRYQSLVPDSHQGGLFLSANYRFDSALELFAEVLATRYKLGGVTTPPFLQLASVPASNAFNPFGATVLVSGLVQGAESLSKFSFNEEFFRPLVGARGKIGAWQWEATVLNSQDRGSQDSYGQPNVALRTAALASSNPATALNPFVDGPMASPDVLASIYSNAVITSYKADATIVDVFGRGPLLTLPAGDLTTVLGAEYQKDTFKRGFNADRTAKAVFAELRAPLIAGGDDGAEKREILAVQGAARYDDYSDFGSKTTWQAGVEFRPVEDLLLRGTHATAFKPPTLYNLASPRLVNTVGLSVTDPMRNGETVIVASTTGGNPDLDPATGTSSTLGFVWSPQRVRGLNLSMTWWKLRIDDAITLPSLQSIVNNESLFPGRVVRAPAPPGEVGQITSVDYSFVNFGTMREEGIDASIDWKLRTAIGDITPAVAATYMTQFEGASTPGAPIVDRLSRANSDGIFAPRWKGIASVAWDPGRGYNAWVDGRYIGRYYDYTPTRMIGNVWYFDATLQVDIERTLGMTKGALGGMNLLVSGTNLANKLPPYSTYFRGYDVYNYDLVGRTIFIRVKFQS